jgi:hypothetical protein
MPTPYSNTQVSDQALPGARVSTDAPAAAFGGGSVLTGPQAAGDKLVTDVQGIAERSYLAANTAAKIKNQNDIDSIKNDGLFGTTDGQGNKIPGLIEQVQNSGPDGAGKIDAFKAQYDDTVSKKMAALPNDDQRAAFANQAADGWRDISKTIEPHFTASVQKYGEVQMKTGIQNQISWATNNSDDPDEIENAKNKLISTVQDWGNSHGQPIDEITQNQSQGISTLYKNVVEKKLANGDYQGAQEFYNGIKDQVTDPTTQIALDKTVRDGVMKGSSQDSADAIVAQYSDKSAAMAALSEEKDPDKRALMRPLVEQGMSIKLEKSEDAKGANFLSGIDAVQKTGDIKNIPPSVWTSMKPQEQQAAIKIAGNFNGGALIKTDPDTWREVNGMKPSDLAAMKPTDVADVRLKLNDFDFAKFKDQWQNAKAGMGGDQAKLDDANRLNTNREIVLTEMANARVAGMTPGTDIQKVNGNASMKIAYDNISSSIEQQIIAQQKSTVGKVLTPDEVRTIANKTVNQKVLTNDQGVIGSLFGTQTEKTLAELSPEEKQNFSVKVTSIPDDAKQKIYQAGLQSGGIPIGTPYDVAVSKYKSNFEKAYGAAVRGKDMNYIKSIMGEK